MTRLERISETLKTLYDEDLIMLWNVYCSHNKYYTDYIRYMSEFDDIEDPYDRDLTFSEQIESIKIDFAHFNTDDDYYNCDIYGHYNSFSHLDDGNSPFDLQSLAEDIDDYEHCYSSELDSISAFDWMLDEDTDAETVE